MVLDNDEIRQAIRHVRETQLEMNPFYARYDDFQEHGTNDGWHAVYSDFILTDISDIEDIADFFKNVEGLFTLPTNLQYGRSGAIFASQNDALRYKLAFGDRE